MFERLPVLTRRYLGTALLVCLLVTASGCAALGEEAPASPTGTAADATSPTPTTSPTSSPTSTATSTATASPRSTASKATPRADAPPSSSRVNGRLAVVIAGDRLDVQDANRTADFWFAPNGTDLWYRSNASVTLAQALSTFGIRATADSLTYRGTTYRDGQDGVSVNVRADGTPVDPTQYVLQDDDEVWVTVETPGETAPTPGTYIHEDQLHMHGDMHVVVNGQSVDFSEPKYQGDDHYFHFENGNFDPWHAHSWSLTLAYALGTIPGMNATADSVTVDNTTYRASDPGTTVSVTVDGQPVDPTTYLLKDGDSIRVVVKTAS